VRAAVVMRRLVLTVPLVIGIVLITFVLLRLMPGDPVDIAMGSGGNVNQQQIEALREALDLDKPLLTQLALFAGRLAKGDLGVSVRDRRPVWDLLFEALPATIELSLVALLLAVLVSLPVGVISAVRPRSLFDRLAMTGSFLGISMPAFFLGLLLMMIFAVFLGWLPTSGRLAAGATIAPITGSLLIDTLVTGQPALFLKALKYLLLPAITLGAELTAILSRVVRSSMTEILYMDYIRTARAKGVVEWRVVLRHGLRNALIPAVTVLGLQFGVLMGGNMIVETIFGWPGLGRLVVGAIFARDYPVVQGAVMLYAVTFMLVNLAVDLVYTFLSPRIQL
jgi:ABC-type dipeptide/oligopeptide/nickel transport system permease component